MSSCGFELRYPSSAYYCLNLYARKRAHSLGCFVQVSVLLHLLLLSKPEDGDDGKSRWKRWPSGAVAAASCESPSGLAKKLMLDVWPSCFQTDFVLPCCFFVVLFYSRNKRADYCSPLGERKRKGHPCADLLWRLSSQMVFR